MCLYLLYIDVFAVFFSDHVVNPLISFHLSHPSYGLSEKYIIAVSVIFHRSLSYIGMNEKNLKGQCHQKCKQG
jgi:hypothetical protein